MLRLSESCFRYAQLKTMKRLYKSRKNKVIAGVFGGIGEYFDIDPVVLRLPWILLVIFTGLIPGIFAYLIAIFVVPARPK